MPASLNDRNKLNELLSERIGKDSTFRDRLLKTPRNAVEEVLGTKVSGDIQIQVVEEKPGEFVIVIPPPTLPAGKQELSDADLDQVVGAGTGIFSSISAG